MDLAEHLKRQIAFSRATFGPGERRSNLIDHIGKELSDVEKTDGLPNEWVDVIILALDGLWRSLRAIDPELSDGEIAARAVDCIEEKQGINERRKWPDWRTADPNKAIERIRFEDDLNG